MGFDPFDGDLRQLDAIDGRRSRQLHLHHRLAQHHRQQCQRKIHWSSLPRQSARAHPHRLESGYSLCRQRGLLPHPHRHKLHFDLDGELRRNAIGRQLRERGKDDGHRSGCPDLERWHGSRHRHQRHRNIPRRYLLHQSAAACHHQPQPRLDGGRRRGSPAEHHRHELRCGGCCLLRLNRAAHNPCQLDPTDGHAARRADRQLRHGKHHRQHGRRRQQRHGLQHHSSAANHHHPESVHRRGRWRGLYDDHHRH